MSVKFTCNTCNKSVSCQSLTECSLCLTMIYLKCNNLNVADAEVIKNTGSDRFWVCILCSNNLFPFTTINDHKLYQPFKVKATTTIVAAVTAILLRHVPY